MKIIETEAERRKLVKQIDGEALPFTVSVWKGKSKAKTDRQNRLMHLWINEITLHYADRTSDRIRAEIKLRWGIPILKDEVPGFAEKFDKVFGGMDYETKVAAIELSEFPVSRIMDTKQATRYFDTIYEYFTRHDVELTRPNEPPNEGSE